jgi:Predicted exporters of the RND superfamily
MQVNNALHFLEALMKKFADFVIRHKAAVLILFLALSCVCAVTSSWVRINYNMADYLPKDAQSTAALSVMKDEFGGELPNARVMVHGVTVQQALDYKDKLASVAGVTAVTWLDDAVGSDVLTSTPVAYLDQAVVGNYYKNNTALFSITIASGQEKDAVAAIRSLIGDGNAVAGDAVNIAESQAMSVTEVVKAMEILIPIVIGILLVSTTSWLEPLLFLISIGVAVLINMGTNVFFGQISFITRTVSPVLQLAVSLDYAIFLLHSFREFRKDNPPKTAMALAMKKAVTAVAASAATTVVGFLALLFMRFQVGSDLGLNLVKGVILSFVSVMTFLPALTLCCCKLLDKTRHRSFLPGFGPVGRLVTKISGLFLILAVLLAVPTYLAQSHIEFLYGTGSISEATRAGKDEAAIEQVFGSDNMLVLLVPRGDAGKEADLCAALSKVRNVTNVVSYATEVGSEIPPEYLTADITDSFYSAHYARIILYTDMPSEGAEAFGTVKAILDTAGGAYGAGTCYLAGQSATLYDMRTIVSKDTVTVSIAAIIGIFLILLITFRSPVTPFLLVFTIESAIWLNLSFAYFSGQSFNFIGYLVISTVQLGATVDYAILTTDRYLRNRKEMPKKEAMRRAVGDNLVAILTSAAILSIAGFTLEATSTNLIISQLGQLLGRGTALSFLMVVLVLPALLMLFDGAMRKTTFFSEKPRGTHTK